jgi:hypothetical protein
VLEQLAGGDIENRVGTGPMCGGGVLNVVGSIVWEIVILRKEGEAIACLRVQFCPWSSGGGPRLPSCCTIVHGASLVGGGLSGVDCTPGSDSGCTPGSATAGGGWWRCSTRECRMSRRLLMATSCSALGAMAVAPRVVWTVCRAWSSLSSVVTIGVQIVRSKFHGVADDDRPRVAREDTIAAVMLECRSDIVTVLSPVVPGVANRGLVVNLHLASRWCQRRGIKVE